MSRRRQRRASAAFEPFLVAELDLADPRIEAIDWHASGRSYRRARVLVLLRGTPLGTVDVARGESIADHVRQKLGAALAAQLERDDEAKSSTSAVDACLATVVIATRERPERLAATLDSVFALDHPRYEVIVVDNAPRTPAARKLVERRRADGLQLRYVREPRPGLALAHNRGLRDARGEIVAFTDDDVDVDSRWLLELARAFEWERDVACVTGLIVPAELETAAQVWLDERVGLNKGYEPRLFDLGRNRPRDTLFPYAAGTFGSGANMAFRTEALRALGGFDPATGAGTRSRGGDDLAAFFGIVASGATIAYQPAAIVRHYHRRDVAGLRRQMFDYGAGLGAYLTKIVVDDPVRLLDLGRRAPHGASHIVGARSSPSLSNDLAARELAGLLTGPARYFRERLSPQA
jgi:O-antigen biosynthesis protein